MSTSVVDRSTTPIHEGKAKRLYATDDPDRVLLEYTDVATAGNGEKRAEIAGKGVLNCEISTRFMEIVERAGVPTHFLEQVAPTEQIVRAVTIVPLEVVVRNIAAGSIAKRLGLEEGWPLPRPIVEHYYKRDDLNDPLLTRAHVSILDLATTDTLDRMQQKALQVNDVLTAHLASRGVTLVDFKLEFGHDSTGALLLADEISPDTCRFWDATTGEKLDKDRFRRDLGGVEQAYTELLRRLVGSEVSA